MSSSAVPSWTDQEHQIFPDVDFNELKLPINIDSVLDPTTSSASFKKDVPTLFRERHGWCPYSERVWWTLELCGISYDTIRIDNTGHGPQPSYWSGTTPQLRWPGETRNRGESMDLVYALDETYAKMHPQGRLLLQSNSALVRHVVSQFRSIFPRHARPSSRAAFLFQNNGEPLWKSTFEATLEATEELLRETPEGPFLCGTTLTAADVAWVPFLERYRYQLPALHGDGLDPYNNSPTMYPCLHQWYQAVDRIPSYACRVSGNASIWRKVLTMAGFGNAGNVPPQIRHNMVMLQQQTVEQLLMESNDTARGQQQQQEQKLWDEYHADRPYLAATPAAEAAHVMVRNRQAIVRDALQRVKSDNPRAGIPCTAMPTTESGLDTALRGLVQILLRMDDKDSTVSVVTFLKNEDLPPDVGALAMYLDERMCVPRDMGALSAKRIAQIAAVASLSLP